MKTELITAFAVSCVLISISAQAEDVKVSTKGGNLKVSSGESTIQIGGRLQYDYNRAELNGDVDEDEFSVRRARFYVKGNVTNDWAYKIDYNLEDEVLEDLWIEYRGFGKAARIKVGNQREPFGLEDRTSSNEISVLERTAQTELFSPGRSEGVVLSGQLQNNFYYFIGGFFVDTDDNDTGDEFSFSARAAWTPVRTETSLLHLGAAVRDDGFETDAFGVEAAYVTGSLHVQAEYADGTVDDIDSDSFYVQAGYFITGEVRPYKDARFKRVTPRSKAGAWEIVARYEDGDGNFSDIELGVTDATSYTLGVNYYPHKNLRIGANYTDGESNVNDDDGEEFRVRFQFAF